MDGIVFELVFLEREVLDGIWRVGLYGVVLVFVVGLVVGVVVVDVVVGGFVVGEVGCVVGFVVGDVLVVVWVVMVVFGFFVVEVFGCSCNIVFWIMLLGMRLL